jgi:hypothetical protein
MKHFSLITLCAAGLLGSTLSQAQEVTVANGSIQIRATKNPNGKNVLLLAGDDEYRSEECMPMLAKLLSTHHGFNTTVCFSVNDKGELDPEAHKSLTNSGAIEKADSIIMLIRFRNWDDESLTRFENYYLAGKPLVAIRTSTHPFNIDEGRKWRDWTWNVPGGGFGEKVMGETWVSHWGKHKVEAARSVVEDANKANPLLNGVGEIFNSADVYEAHPPKEATVLLRGAILAGMNETDKPVEDKRNSPMMPVAWTLDHKNPAGKTNKVFTTTLGSAVDMQDPDMRRLIVNATYWSLGMEIPQEANVDIVGPYAPTMYGFKTFQKGLKPEDMAKLK